VSGRPDLLAGHWELISRWRRVPRVLVWDNESAIGKWRAGKPELTAAMNAFRGMLGIKVVQCRPGDPEAKGLVERANGYLETPFLPGPQFQLTIGFQHPVGRLVGHRERPSAPRIGVSTDRPVEHRLCRDADVATDRPSNGMGGHRAAGPRSLRAGGLQRLFGASQRHWPQSRFPRRPGNRSGALRRTPRRKRVHIQPPLTAWRVTYCERDGEAMHRAHRGPAGSPVLVCFVTTGQIRTDTCSAWEYLRRHLIGCRCHRIMS
jgi:hypothetical protein